MQKEGNGLTKLHRKYPLKQKITLVPVRFSKRHNTSQTCTSPAHLGFSHGNLPRIIFSFFPLNFGFRLPQPLQPKRSFLLKSQI